MSPKEMHGWAFYDDTTNGAGTGTLVEGPADPPSGKGSARLALTGPTDRQVLSTVRYAGTAFKEITALGYWTYRASADAGNLLAIALQFDVDYDLTDANNAWQGRLVFEPYQSGAVVPQNSWQRWNALQGKWWATKAPGLVVCPQSAPCTWAEVLAHFPNAGVRAGVGYLHFKAGGGWAVFDGNVDAFTIGVGEEDQTTWDFEPSHKERSDEGDE